MKMTLNKDEHVAIDLIPKSQRAELRTNVAVENGKDVRICDGKHVVTIRLANDSNTVLGVLVDDVYVWAGGSRT